MTPCSPIHAAGGELRRCPNRTRFTVPFLEPPLLAQESDAALAASPWCEHSLASHGEISPDKNALLHFRTVGSTPSSFDDESFAASGLLVLVSSAF